VGEWGWHQWALVGAGGDAVGGARHQHGVAGEEDGVVDRLGPPVSGSE
jgi:hypothetical protein